MKKCLIIERHEEQAKTIERCVLCNEKIGPSYKERLREKTDAIPQEQRQKFLDAMHAGKNLGDAREEAGIEDLMVASQIVLDNIQSYEFLGTKAV